MCKWLLPAALLFALPALADDPKPKRPPVETFTDPAKAGPDYQVQGEYVGTLPDGTKIGSQVIADGDGQFTGKSHGGGLPGDGWDGQTVWRFAGKTVNGATTFTSDEANCTFETGTIKVTLHGGDTFELKRVVRRSPTEGAKPPAGAVVLFDGTSADAWDHGKIENGLLSVMVRGGQTSKQKFADCTVHAEFLLPFMPRARGQARANSGVYLQGRYEVQVLDSFGLAGKNNECGGIYELSDPKVNMCYPPLQWQTYDIDYTAARFGADGTKASNARMTVRHNGVVVQDDVELKRDTRGGIAKEGPETGPLHLQNHGNPVYYRNVWVVEKK